MSEQTQIHPTAIIEKGAQLDFGVKVGPYAYIGSGVSIAKGTVVHHHATVGGLTELGKDNEIFPYAFIGAKTHDLKYKGGEPGLRIGNRNTFREYVTVHCATNAGEYTVMGDNNVMLAYSHVAHDCIIGNHMVMSSQAALAGHVIVEDYVNIGWGCGVHQFCRLGAFSLTGAMSKVVQDVLPFVIVDGSPAEARTVNKIGLERKGFPSEDIDIARFVYKRIYREGLNRSQAMASLEKDPRAGHWIVQQVCNFAKKGNGRGFV